MVSFCRTKSINHSNQSTCLTRVTPKSLATDKPVALKFRIELEFGNVGFWGEGKTGVPEEKPLGARREPTTNSTHI